MFTQLGRVSKDFKSLEFKIKKRLEDEAIINKL